MLSISRRSLLMAGFAAFATTRAFPQEPVFSSEVKLVNVVSTVRTRKGEIVRDLTKDDFILEEDDQPRAIRYFSRDNDLPLTLGMLIDTSHSQRRVLGEEKSASYLFLDRVIREDKDAMFLMSFDSEVNHLLDTTSSRAELAEALKLVKIPRRAGTRLFDAVEAASNMQMRQRPGRKALILLTDGVNWRSEATLADSLEAAQRSDTLVYSLLFADPRAYGRGPKPKEGREVLQRMAQETGGGYFVVSKKLTLDQIYHQLEEELRSQYVLYFTPTDLKDDASTAAYHSLRVTTRKKGLIVQARQGYYPHPQAPKARRHS